MKSGIMITLFLWNIIIFALYGVDKWKSKHGRWRVREKTLIVSAFLMGAVGAILGMKIFHHKTKHTKFKVLLPLALIFDIGVMYFANRYLQTF